MHGEHHARRWYASRTRALAPHAPPRPLPHPLPHPPTRAHPARYGTVPVAHKTGGLRDTVVDFDPFVSPPAGTGWTFDRFECGALVHTAGVALTTLTKHPDDFQGLQRRGMARDSSWDGAAKAYEQVFDWMHMDDPHCK